MLKYCKNIAIFYCIYGTRICREQLPRPGVQTALSAHPGTKPNIIGLPKAVMRLSEII